MSRAPGWPHCLHVTAKRRFHPIVTLAGRLPSLAGAAAAVSAPSPDELAELLPACQAGTFINLTSLACQPCPRGHFSSIDGARSCAPCPRGTWQSALGATTCNGCPAGTAGHLSGAHHVMLCEACPVGSFADAPGATWPCKVRRGGVARQPRPAQAAGAGGVAGGLCMPAVPCSHTPRAYLQPCPPGTFTRQHGAASCTACPPGTAWDGSGQLSTSCPACPHGTFASRTGSTVCDACPPGTLAEVPGLSTCQVCPAGTASAAWGAWRRSSCQACPAGTFAEQGSTFCKARGAASH